MNMSTATPLSRLPGLHDWCRANGFSIEDVSPEKAKMTDHEGGSIWWLYRVEAWLQVKAAIFEDIDPTQALGLTLLRLHSRLLGCRFGIEKDGSLCVLADVFPHEQTGEGVGAALTQMQWVVDYTHGLLCRVQETGFAANETDIDDAFQSENFSPLN